jgi:hypothetical protein
MHECLLIKTGLRFKRGISGDFHLRRHPTFPASNHLPAVTLVMAVITFILAAGPASSSDSGNRQVWRTAELTLIFDRRGESLAAEVQRFFPDVKRELEEGFGWVLGVKPTIVLIPTREDFQRIVPGPLFVAVAVPARNTIIVDTSRFRTAPLNLRMTVTHELAHLLLHEHIDGDRLPRWLDEGVCQWFTGGVAEIMIDRQRPMLGKALGSGERIDLADLTHRFPSEPRQLMLAYEQSRDIVTLIANRYGPVSIIGILNRLRAGDPVEAAIFSELGITQAELEHLWQRQLTDSAVWWGRLATHLYSILFFIAAVLTIVGFAVRRIRRKQRLEDDDSDGGKDDGRLY